MVQLKILLLWVDGGGRGKLYFPERDVIMPFPHRPQWPHRVTCVQICLHNSLKFLQKGNRSTGEKNFPPNIIKGVLSRGFCCVQINSDSNGTMVGPCPFNNYSNYSPNSSRITNEVRKRQVGYDCCQWQNIKTEMQFTTTLPSPLPATLPIFLAIFRVIEHVSYIRGRR